MFPLSSWQKLSNGPPDSDDVVTLRTSLGGITVDEINHDDASPCRLTNPMGRASTVWTGFLDAVSDDNGANWARSVMGVDGAFQNTVTTEFHGTDTGSPGFVCVPSPSSRLMGLLLLPRAGAGHRLSKGSADLLEPIFVRRQHDV